MKDHCMSCEKSCIGEEECFWCETPYCSKCVKDKNGAYVRNGTYVVCSFCDEVPITGQR